MFIHHGDGSCSTCYGRVGPKNQICDLLYGFNSNIESDVNFVGRSLLHEPRLIMLNAWLKEDYIDPQDKLHHLDK
eukprot:6180144-Karenia_brevis.AAC.1